MSQRSSIQRQNIEIFICVAKSFLQRFSQITFCRKKVSHKNILQNIISDLFCRTSMSTHPSNKSSLVKRDILLVCRSLTLSYSHSLSHTHTHVLTHSRTISHTHQILLQSRFLSVLCDEVFFTGKKLENQLHLRFHGSFFALGAIKKTS